MKNTVQFKIWLKEVIKISHLIYRGYETSTLKATIHGAALLLATVVTRCGSPVAELLQPGYNLVTTVASIKVAPCMVALNIIRPVSAKIANQGKSSTIISIDSYGAT